VLLVSEQVSSSLTWFYQIYMPTKQKLLSAFNELKRMQGQAQLKDIDGCHSSNAFLVGVFRHDSVCVLMWLLFVC